MNKTLLFSDIFPYGSTGLIGKFCKNVEFYPFKLSTIKLTFCQYSLSVFFLFFFFFLNIVILHMIILCFKILDDIIFLHSNHIKKLHVFWPINHRLLHAYKLEAFKTKFKSKKIKCKQILFNFFAKFLKK